MGDNVWTDEALRSGEQDTLGRRSYAQRAADLIHTTHSFESSAVFGLSGPWGSGKTSLVNMIVQDLKSAHPDWAVAKFTPWATSDVSGLLGEFYSSLTGVLPKKKSEQVRRALAVATSVAAPAANLIPIAGEVAAEGILRLSDSLAKTPSWQVAFNNASNELKKLEKPILVVVDDIDRLHGDELLALLKVVRLLGRFDGVQYLLAYDDETLYRSMTTSNAVTPHDGSAERFMEKIVQYPLFVPPLLNHQQIARLQKGLARISRESVDDGASVHRLSALADCFTDLLRTPRAIDRYIAQLQHHVPLLPPNEVDDQDVQLLTLIRVSFPALFNSIPRYRSELVTGHTGKMKVEAEPLAYELFDIETLLKVVPKEHRATARELLVSLFPKIRKNGQRSVQASTRRQSVQHDAYFDRYFAMGILEHDVSDATVDAAVAKATEGDGKLLVRLLVGRPPEFRILVIGKCLSPSNQPTTNAGRIQLAEVLARIANDNPSEYAAPFSELDQLLTWISALLVELENNTPSDLVQSVLSTFNDQVVRIFTWSRLEQTIKSEYQSEKSSWYDEVTETLVKESLVDFLDHLKQGDNAATGPGIGFQVDFILRHGADRLRTAVCGLLKSSDLDLATLASRLVPVRIIAGAESDGQLYPDVDQRAFNQIAPPGEDPWYEQSTQEVDLWDLSWENRRKFAAGRFTPPPGINDQRAE